MSTRYQKAWRRELVRIAGALGQMRGFRRALALEMFECRRSFASRLNMSMWGQRPRDPLAGVSIPRSLRKVIRPAKEEGLRPASRGDWLGFCEGRIK